MSGELASTSETEKIPLFQDSLAVDDPELQKQINTDWRRGALAASIGATAFLSSAFPGNTIGEGRILDGLETLGCIGFTAYGIAHLVIAKRIADESRKA